MKKSLIKSGGGWALFLNKPLIELLEIDPVKDEVELEFEGKTLKISKAKNDEGK